MTIDDLSDDLLVLMPAGLGFAETFVQAICSALQHGVPLQALVDKFSHARFEPRP